MNLVISISKLTTLMLLIIAFFSLSSKTNQKDLYNVSDKIVYVEGSSGVIVSSTKDMTTVLTSYHVIDHKIDKHGNRKSEDSVYVSFIIGTRIISYRVIGVAVDETKDLALISFKPGFTMNYAKISSIEPKVGDEVILIGNPNFNYRTVTKGIISSKQRIVNKSYMWQVSGGLTHGSSGGGVFNTSGELIGISRAVDTLRTNFCTKERLDAGDMAIEVRNCYADTISYIGYIVPLINNFNGDLYE